MFTCVHVPIAVVMEAVVAGHGDQGSPCCTNGVEYLHGCFSPHLHTQQFLPLGNEIELDAIPGAW